MSESIAELIAVFVIVGAVILLWVRSFFRMITDKRKGQCCGCGSCMCEKDPQRMLQKRL